MLFEQMDGFCDLFILCQNKKPRPNQGTRNIRGTTLVIAIMQSLHWHNGIGRQSFTENNLWSWTLLAGWTSIFYCIHKLSVAAYAPCHAAFEYLLFPLQTHL